MINIAESTVMKPLQYLLFSILMSIAVQANALDQDMQVDLQMAKINTALKANRPADAVPYFCSTGKYRAAT